RQSAVLVEREGAEALSPQAALALQREGRFAPVDAAVPKFGIGAAPVWLHWAIEQRARVAELRQLVVGVPWVDRIDVYLLRDGAVVAHFAGGDGEAGLQPAAGSLGYVFNHAFEPGVTDLLVRAASPDPLVVPLRLLTPAAATAAQRAHDYGYGLLYGYLLALIVYNAMLYVGLRDRSQRDYVLYVGSFLLLSMAYSGHGQVWLWPDQPEIQRYAILVLMVLFGCMGLRFAGSFLGLRSSLPGLDRLVRMLVAGGTLAMVLCVALDLQAAAGVVAFVFTQVFALAMVWIGVVSVRRDRIAAPYFLTGALIAMAGTAITTFAVWHGLPYSAWTLHAAEVGIALDGTVLTLALAYRMRRLRGERLRAEHLAATDPLTGLRNRRAFTAEAKPLWQAAQQGGRPLSAIVLDLDHFKALNDAHGHAAGDAALVAVARLLEQGCREADLVARWGGEEFVVLMPDTRLEQARRTGMRLLEAMRAAKIEHEGRPLPLSASVGVAERGAHADLQALIDEADHWMYEAKRVGRGCVCCSDTIGGCRS
ncbi:MAG: sensor domain-containing diguanylate cyclase, partial [Thauera sp.]